MNPKAPLLNRQINLSSVRVVDAKGTQHGIMSSDSAYNLAQTENLDLVLITPNASPPVCKIIDWGKHQFNMKKRAKESKAKQTVIDIKEIQLRPTTDTHDLQTKIKHAIKFISKGKHVRFQMRFRGRETSHSDIGMKIMKNILETLGDSIIIEKHPVLNGRNITMLVSPRTK